VKREFNLAGILELINESVVQGNELVMREVHGLG
jgi:hypothetical protein